MIDYTNTQTIFDSIKTADNSDLWAFAGEVAKMHKQASKDNASNDNFVLTDEYIKSLNIDELLSDQTKLRTRVMASLIRESDSGNAQASDKLARIGGLEQMTSDLSIECVVFSDTVIHCPGCGKNVYEADKVAQ